MRTDVKLGIVAGLVLVLVIVVYVFHVGDDGPPLENAAPTDVASEQEGSGDPKGQDVAGTDKLPTEENKNDEELIAFHGLSTPVEKKQPPAPPKPSALVPDKKPTKITGLFKTFERPVGVGKTESETPGRFILPVHREGKTSKKPVTTVQKPRTYVVRAGDAGFWGIAARQEVYGNGSKWELIKEANPDVNSKRLHPGQKLVIPPLAQTPKVSGKQLVKVGKDSIIPGGWSVYTVKAGDAGFWGVAAKAEVYGNGSKWHLIKLANPDVRTHRLVPGQKLMIPPLAKSHKLIKPTTRGTTRTTPVKSAPRKFPSDGRPRFY